MNQSRTKSTQRKKPNDVVDNIVIDNDDPIKPDDQLILTPEELDEQYGNVLSTEEPPKLQVQIIYSIKNKKFLPKVEKTLFTTLINSKSSLLWIDSAEAEVQINNESCRMPEVLEIKANDSMVEVMEDDEEDMDFENNNLYKNIMPSEEGGEEFQMEEDEMQEETLTVGEENVLSTIRDADDALEVEKESHKSDVSEEVFEQSIKSLPVKPYCTVVKLNNKFSFFDRNTGTQNVVRKDMETQTTTTKKAQFRTLVSLLDIYDAYSKDMAIQEAIKEEEMKKKMAAHLSKKKSADDNKNYTLITYDKRTYCLFIVSKIVEKIISFNETEAIAQDFRYYEDQSDQFREKGEGTLMMMWSMVYEKERSLIVTDISWSPDYFDMFGLTLSIPLNTIISQDDSSDVGYICLWSLKNSSYPQVVNQTHSGAISLSFHHEHGYIYAVGLRDGSLAVYNASLLTDKPQFKTDVNDAKHTGCVRQVVWREDLPTGEMNFYSVSDDGTVCQWILLQSEMIKIVKISLTIDMHPELELGGLKQTYNAIGTTITFHPSDPERFLIGTNEGYIFKCNTEWCYYVRRFRAHNLKVNRIDYNKFDATIYVTCSEDFTVKLWNDQSEVPLMVINLKTCLSDVCWSPFSSTVFCVLTENCRAIFYDLDANLKKPVCDQLVLSPDSDYKLVRLAFDRRVPLIVIGSFKGTAILFKLSPNLRSIMKSPKKGIQIPTETLELEKLQAVLQTIKR